ncbi:homocysteine S-methyltransferase [Isosphaera pallida ATCC 43644]|uniref:Homocysteine S-methyltransferase n=1 Tax=Isosphaera pallida (strain ATCC 43644 / DSM 9630 / IS1B) TaxID=575540 RepID=E8R4X3_ISOPI|nr:homocysteine S-methyltransferase family protein [Isosphaera pallida]ADV61719.1 homocysteine S-methyltransferase [Isosphaera pallida ATCC 43644]
MTEPTRPAPILFDGPMGTRLLARGLDLRVEEACEWSLDHPEEVEAIHRADCLAGASLLRANVFTAHRDGLERRGQGRGARLPRLLTQAVDLARRAGEGLPVVAALGPVGSHEEAAVHLVDHGVAAIWLETYTFLHALDQLPRLKRRIGQQVPIWVTLFNWRDDPEQGPITAQAARLIEAGAAAIGVNCVSCDDPQRIPLMTALRAAAGTRVPLIASPSIPPPPPDRPAPTPLEVAEQVLDWWRAGADGIGLCCGGNATHLAALHTLCADLPPRDPHSPLLLGDGPRPTT